jgi:hypothetical protein
MATSVFSILGMEFFYCAGLQFAGGGGLATKLREARCQRGSGADGIWGAT